MSKSNLNSYFKDLIKKANDGDQDAMNILHDEYCNETDFKQTFDEELVDFYKTTAEEDAPYSTFYYGYMCFNGLGVKRDKDKAIALIKRSVLLGCSQGYYYLAILQTLGECMDDNLRSDYDLLEEGIKLKNSNAYDLMAIYLQDEEPKKAIKYYKEAIKLGHTNAMSRLGQYYHDNGNFEMAKKYYKMGMDKNNSHCYFNYAVMHREGEGFERNIRESIKYFERAVELGNVRAMVCLGATYQEMGDYEQAMPYLEMAVEKDDPLACYNLGKLYKDDGELKKAAMMFVKGGQLEHYPCLRELSRAGLNFNATEEEIDQMLNMREAFKNFGAW